MSLVIKKNGLLHICENEDADQLRGNRNLSCGSRLTLFKKCIGIVGDSFFTVFRCSRLEWCVEICAILQENA